MYHELPKDRGQIAKAAQEIHCLDNISCSGEGQNRCDEQAGAADWSNLLDCETICKQNQLNVWPAEWSNLIWSSCDPVTRCYQVRESVVATVQAGAIESQTGALQHQAKISLS